MTVLKKYYLVSCRTKSGGRKFIALDPSSGGYPWWTDIEQSAERFYTLEQATRESKFEGHMLTDVSKVEVLAVTPMATVVDTTDVAKAMAEIEALEKELEAKRAALKNM